MQHPVSGLPRRTVGPCALLRSLAGTLIVSLCVGCLDNSCHQISEDPVTYTDGKTNAKHTFYESSTSGEPFLRFPAGRVYRMEHRLAAAPTQYDVWVSFFADGGDHAIASGNLALLNVNERYIQVTNNTCSDLFVKVTASTELSTAPIQDAALAETGDATFAINPSEMVDAAQDAAVTTSGDAN